MKFFTRAVFCGLFLITTINLPAQQKQNLAVIEELKQLQSNWHKAYVVSDSIKLLSLLSPDVTIIRSSGLKIKKSQALSFYRTRDTAGLTVNTIDQNVQIDRSLAVLSCKVAERDKELPYVYFVTDVFENKNSEWQLVRSQWTLLPGQWDKIKVDSVILKSYEGKYETTAGRTLIVDVQPGQVTITNARGRKTILYPRSAMQFFIPGEPDELLFIKAEHESRSSALVLVSRTNTSVFYRKN